MSGWKVSNGVARRVQVAWAKTRRFGVVVAVAMASHVPAPGIALPEALITKAALLDLVYAGDVDGVERALSTAQQLYLDDAIPADEVRRLFEDFTTTNPKIIAFTGDWVEAMPDSAYANTAQAWVLYRIAGLIRGDRPGWATYPVALEQFDALSETAMVHASTAYTLAPDLIPASDAILRLANSVGAASFGYEIMDEVMQSHPNWGTLFRGLKLTQPGYGGRPMMADAMCAYYGAELRAPHADMVRFCRIVGIFEFHLRGQRDLLEDLLDGFEAPELDYIRAKLAMLDWQNPDRLQTYQDVLQAYFDEHDVMDVKMAGDFDMFFGHIPGHRMVQGEVSKRAYEYARTAIQDDPYDPWLLDVLGTGALDATRDGDTLTVSYKTHLSHARRLELLSMRLVVSPFEPNHWKNLASSMEAVARGDRPTLEGLFASDPYRINAIAYGNHRAEYLIDYIRWKIIQLDVTARLSQVNATPLASETVHSFDRDGEIICPLLRAARVLGIINTYQEQPETYGLTAMEAGQIDGLSDQARQDGRCTEVRTADPGELGFEPVEVKLMLTPLVDQL